MIAHVLRLFRIMTVEEVVLTCVLCGQSRDWLSLCLEVLDLIELHEDGILSSDGIGVLLRLKRLPCKRCLVRMLGASHSISCESSTDTERIGDGIFSTKQNSGEGSLNRTPGLRPRMRTNPVDVLREMNQETEAPLIKVPVPPCGPCPEERNEIGLIDENHRNGTFSSAWGYRTK